MNTELDVSAWGIYDLFIHNYINLNYRLVSKEKEVSRVSREKLLAEYSQKIEEA